MLLYALTWVRNTAALFCMMRCMLRLISAVRRLPSALRSLSSRARVRSAESAGRGGRGVLGLRISPASRCTRDSLKFHNVTIIILQPAGKAKICLELRHSSSAYLLAPSKYEYDAKHEARGMSVQHRCIPCRHQC